jgi:hypothetical protein
VYICTSRIFSLIFCLYLHSTMVYTVLCTVYPEGGLCSETRGIRRIAPVTVLSCPDPELGHKVSLHDQQFSPPSSHRKGAYLPFYFPFQAVVESKMVGSVEKLPANQTISAKRDHNRCCPGVALGTRRTQGVNPKTISATESQSGVG